MIDGNFWGLGVQPHPGVIKINQIIAGFIFIRTRFFVMIIEKIEKFPVRHWIQANVKAVQVNESYRTGGSIFIRTPNEEARRHMQH